MRRHTPAQNESAGSTEDRGALLQRKCGCGGTCDQCTKKRLQRSPQGDGGAFAPESVNQVVRSPGKPLAAPVRTGMEQQFGHDFSRVRVHDDGASAASAEQVGANAYTVGNDIVFNRGRYAAEGDELLRHELTHVVQQQKATGPASSRLEIGDAGSAEEREADAVARGGHQTTIGGRTSGPRLQASFGQSFLNTLVDIVGFIPHLFGSEWFTEDQLKQYLDGLWTRKAIENGIFSDNKARACVSRQDELGPYDTATQILLVQEMNTGHVSSLDESSINLLLRRAPIPERQKIVAAIGRDALWSSFSGRNRRILEALTMTAADATDALVGRLRTVDADALKDYQLYTSDPAVQQVIQRAMLLSQITAPVPDTAAIAPLPPTRAFPGGPMPANVATFTIGGTPVFAMPDIVDPSLGKINFTDLLVQWELPALAPPAADEAADATVGELAPPKVQLGVRTRYGSAEAPGRASAYGAGTRPGDPNTLRFHERTHSETWFAFVRRNPPPPFNGSGMTRAAFVTAVANWNTAMQVWEKSALDYSTRMTDCVGTLPTAETFAGTGFTASICTQQPAGTGD